MKLFQGSSLTLLEKIVDEIKFLFKNHNIKTF